MAKQSFTAGQVLTAAQQNALQLNDYNQTVSTKTVSYVLVAADAGTRIVMNAGATNTTITVNTSLFAAGDTLEILNTSTSGICTITAGTATVSSASSLALGKNAGGKLYFTSAGVSVFQASDSGDGLAYISTTDFSGGSTIQFQNLFTSAYTNYRALFTITAASPSAVYMRYLVGATVQTGNIYCAQTAIQQSIPNTYAGYARSDQYSLWATSYPTYPSVMTVDFFYPQAVSYTNFLYSFMTGLSATDFVGGEGYGRNAATTQIDGIELYTGSAAISGTMTLYGYRK